ncbi:LOW QUALITY PROTEIN: histone-lysine N-methyltransferase eggless-like [Macrobrachium nipponense]|uniref:LOW QUALITY PROTEIN: histone-lysine N-methyltransferase eggless-like n=1 Tax=Macrobrachium nipponense TaxID=159736 RepID=UPI0030C88D3F
MVSYCAVFGCGNNSEREVNKSYFKIPRVTQNGKSKESVLSQLRQEAWISSLSSSNLNAEDLKAYRVCSDHFVKGKPCRLYDVDNIDWVPTQNLGERLDYIRIRTRSPEPQRGIAQKIPTSDCYALNKETTTDSNFGPTFKDSVHSVLKENNSPFLGVAEHSRTHSKVVSVVPEGSQSNNTHCKESFDSSGKTLTHSVLSTQDIPKKRSHSKKDPSSKGSGPFIALHLEDHSYTKTAVEGDLSDTDSSRTISAASDSSCTLSAASPPCYYSSESDDEYVFLPAASVIIPEDESLLDKEAYVLVVEPDPVSSEDSSLLRGGKKELSPDESDLPDCLTSFLCAMEVIEISDDENVVEEVPKKKPSGGVKRPFRCINSECRTEKDLLYAKLFVRRHFGVPPCTKKRKVCLRCFDIAKQEQDQLVKVVESGQLLLEEKLPPPKTTVVLTDSDSDPSEYDSSSEGSDLEVECDEGKTVEETIKSIMTDLQLDKQISLGISHLDERLKAVEEGFEKHADEYASIEKELDKVRKEFYDNFRPDIMTSEVIAESFRLYSNGETYSVGPLNRYELKPNEMCFCMKYSLFARWVQAQVVEVEKREPKNTLYKIRYNRNAKGSGTPHVLPGRQIAYYDKCSTRIPVGTRVIAKYKDEDPKNSAVSGSFYVGVLAEIPTAANKYRYLVFFDDGYAQYVHHNDIRVVTEASVCPWDDVSSDSREFIKEYLQMYPERPMVRLQKYNFVKTEYKCQNVFFHCGLPIEWIYRGSTRLSPLFNKKLNIQAQAEQFKTIRRRTAGLPGRAIVEYGTFGQGHDVEPSANQSERRAVAKKSTMSRAGTPPKEVQVRIEQESRGFTNKHTLQEKIMKYRRHMCTSSCLGEGGDSMRKHKDVSPLLYPILQGWNRLVVKQRRKTITKSEIFYVAPCGLRLRNIEEVFQYIVDTESSLEIDCFSFEPGIDVSHEWEPFKRILFLEPGKSVLVRQLTIQGTPNSRSQRKFNAGYQHRRLYDQVQSGIYECNSRCTCALNRCSNRVVQHPLRLKLQLFKTARRGWGVRSLCDIPRGAFICVYVGKMLSESIANEEGKQIIGGDDYYAELDYIEVMENAKEGFEEEALMPEEENLSILPKDNCKSSIFSTPLHHQLQYCPTQRAFVKFFHSCLACAFTPTNLSLPPVSLIIVLIQVSLGLLTLLMTREAQLSLFCTILPGRVQRTCPSHHFSPGNISHCLAMWGPNIHLRFLILNCPVFFVI